MASEPSFRESGSTTIPLARGDRMDKKIERQAPRGWIAVAVGAVLVAAIGWLTWDRFDGRTQRLTNTRLEMSSVTRGEFEDFIPIRARVEPARTLYLDAIEGGRVEKIFVEDGAMVERGQPIVELSNTTLQLDFLAREAEVTEQLNIMRTQELQLEQNRLEHKRNLVEINYNITRLGRQLSRTEKVAEQGHISAAELDTLRDELDYWKARKEVTLESQASDERLQKAQMAQLRSAAVRLERNLDIARRTLESLQVRAPKAGKLTAFNVEVGQSLDRGERVGQIDDPGAYKLVALIDEFYVNRVGIGQTATTAIDGDEYVVESKKIYPQIRDGQFEVDFVFNGDVPAGIRRGQTVQAKLALGATTTSLLIPNGAFFQDTGGNWVFVVADDGETALKRPVRLGRRNIRYIEVLDGLEEGERIITSPYTNFIDSDRLELGSGTTD